MTSVRRTVRVVFPECPVCCEPRSEWLVCQGCRFAACLECSDKTLKSLPELRCMSCKEIFPYSAIRTLFGVEWLRERTASETASVIQRLERTILRSFEASQRSLEAGMAALEDKFPHLSSRDRKRLASQLYRETCPCPAPECELHLVLPSKAPTASRSAVDPIQRCANSHLVCTTCLVHLGDASADASTAPSAPVKHRCDPNDLATLKETRRKTKPCPGCSVPTHKIEGCDYMYCVVCQTTWDWGTGAVTTVRGHNPHDPRSGRRREAGDIPGGAIPGTGETPRPPAGSLARLFYDFFPGLLIWRLAVGSAPRPTYFEITQAHAQGKTSRAAWERGVTNIYEEHLYLDLYADLLETVFLKSLAILNAPYTEEADAKLYALIDEVNLEARSGPIVVPDRVDRDFISLGPGGVDVLGVP